MVNSLFSIFDPSSFLYLNWLLVLAFMAASPISTTVPHMISSAFSLLLKPLRQDLASALSSSSPEASSLLSILSSILLMNYLGLMPHSFTPTSQLALNISFSVVVWSSGVAFGLFLNFKSFMSHLVPSGSPSPLMPFMVIVESISIIIRPMTLAVRLMANMVAGHLLLSLAGTAVSISSFSLLGVYLLLLLELGVAFIQAYVFCILLSLYSSEASYRCPPLPPYRLLLHLF